MKRVTIELTEEVYESLLDQARRDGETVERVLIRDAEAMARVNSYNRRRAEQFGPPR